LIRVVTEIRNRTKPIEMSKNDVYSSDIKAESHVDFMASPHIAATIVCAAQPRRGCKMPSNNHAEKGTKSPCDIL